MRLCMFHPAEQPLERGWVGRIDGEHVTQLAAQTLQSFFTGGGAAREHAVYPLTGVQLLAPVLHPPSVRVFASETSFEFANPAAICSPNAEVSSPAPLVVLPRVAAVVGAEGEPAGLTIFAEWRRPGVGPPKDRDFALGLGPMVVTPDELPADGIEAVVRVDGDERLRAPVDDFDWTAARDVATAGTRLHPGDVLAGPSLSPVEVAPGGTVEIEIPDIGVLAQAVSRD
jgi:Fumarylacetoacetate (FAA) hydrolase family